MGTVSITIDDGLDDKQMLLTYENVEVLIPGLKIEVPKRCKREGMSLEDLGRDQIFRFRAYYDGRQSGPLVFLWYLLNQDTGRRKRPGKRLDHVHGADFDLRTSVDSKNRTFQIVDAS